MVISFHGATIFCGSVHGTELRFICFFASNQVDTILNLKKCSEPRPQGMVSALNLVCNLSTWTINAPNDCQTLERNNQLVTVPQYFQFDEIHPTTQQQTHFTYLTVKRLSALEKSANSHTLTSNSDKNRK